LATNAANAVPVGTYFGLPGFTQPFEQYENLNGIVTALSQSAQTPWNPPGSFQKTDIVKWWELETIVTFTAAIVGTSLSAWAPYNLFQTFKLKLQGQYTPVEVESGVDLGFFQMYRPMRGPGQSAGQSLMGSYPQGVIASGTYAANPPTLTGLAPENIGYQTSGNAAATFPYQTPAVLPGSVNATGATTGAAGSFSFNLEVPGGLFLDAYWDQAIDGTLLPNASGSIAPMSAFVSPQYMGGGERVVVPTFSYAALGAANQDQGPWYGTASAGAASVTQNGRRVGYYGSANPAELPPVFNWQYRRASKRYPVGAFSKVDIPVTEYGQLLSVYVRLFDPTANAPVSVSNFTKTQVLYGSNLPRFDDDILTMQQRFLYQHGFLPPQGFVAWDMLANTSGSSGLSNDFKVLNTLTNANTHIHIETTSAPSAQTYAVIGTELLVPVATQ
jgi:hypothetical protein